MPMKKSLVRHGDAQFGSLRSATDFHVDVPLRFRMTNTELKLKRERASSQLQELIREWSLYPSEL